MFFFLLLLSVIIIIIIIIIVVFVVVQVHKNRIARQLRQRDFQDFTQFPVHILLQDWSLFCPSKPISLS